jgi:hypothetical protein
VTHAKSFSRAEGGWRPVSPIESFVVAGVPARIAPFKTCVRISSGEKVPVAVRTALKTPSGEEMLSSRSEVAFGSKDTMELVIDWEGFSAARTGDYKLAVSLDGGRVAEFPFQVQQVK